MQDEQKEEKSQDSSGQNVPDYSGLPPELVEEAKELQKKVVKLDQGLESLAKRV